MLASRLKTKREQLGANKRQLAKELDIPYTTYCNYEAGTREPNSEMLKKIASFYSTTVDYLLGINAIQHLDDIDTNEIIGRINDRAKEKGLEIDEVLSACNIEINSFVEFSKKVVSLADCLDCAVDYIMGRSDSVNIPMFDDAEVSIEELLNTVGSKALIEELLKREEH